MDWEGQIPQVPSASSKYWGRQTQDWLEISKILLASQGILHMPSP